MYTLRLLNRSRPVQLQARLISNFKTLRDAKPVNTASATVQEPAAKTSFDNPSVMGPKMVVPRNIDKKILVWMKYYKSVDEIPDKVVYETLDKAQNWFRIRCLNYMMLAMVVATIVVVYAGKKRAARGESLDQMNLDWHKKIKEEHDAQIAAAKKE